MSPNKTNQRIWDRWVVKAQQAAKARWDEAQQVRSPRCTGQEWEQLIRQRLAPLSDISVLRYKEHERIQWIRPEELSPPARAARDRIAAEAEIHRQNLYAIGISAADGADERQHGLLHFNDGTRLVNGALSLLVFIDEREQRPISMNIQLRGLCPVRWQSLYHRFDLDAIQMGGGPAAHFNAHWHAGSCPDSKNAEDLDPRLPSLPLSPDAVIDFLVMTYFPDGPKNILERDDSQRVQEHLSRAACTLGNRLRSRREELSCGLDDFSQLVGIDRSVLDDIEEGRRDHRDTVLLLVKRLSDQLDCSPAWLAFGVDR